MLKSIGPLTGPSQGQQIAPAVKRPGGAFGELLAQEARKQGDVKFSAHAQERLESRQIQLSDQDKARLGQAVTKADEKGANKSLILMDDLALVVSVRNRVVITALDEPNAKSNVFTNIDSAVIA